jgi:hypothetical protein
LDVDAIKRPLRRIPHWALRSVRRRYYCDGWGSVVVGALPEAVRRATGLDDLEARDSRRIEIGSGDRPQPGYIHVDADRWAWHLEVVAPVWQLPFPDGWAREVLAIHCLEHVHPRRMFATLRECRRVLAEDGTLRVHVPNSPAIMTSFLNATNEQKWSLGPALLGMYISPAATRPEDVPLVPADHQVCFDRPLMRWALAEAGFCNIVDRSDEITDVHTEAWAHLVDRISLVIEATAGADELKQCSAPRSAGQLQRRLR